MSYLLLLKPSHNFNAYLLYDCCTKTKQNKNVIDYKNLNEYLKKEKKREKGVKMEQYKRLH